VTAILPLVALSARWSKHVMTNLIPVMGTVFAIRMMAFADATYLGMAVVVKYITYASTSMEAASMAENAITIVVFVTARQILVLRVTPVKRKGIVGSMVVNMVDHALRRMDCALVWLLMRECSAVW